MAANIESYASAPEVVPPVKPEPGWILPERDERGGIAGMTYQGLPPNKEATPPTPIRQGAMRWPRWIIILVAVTILLVVVALATSLGVVLGKRTAPEATPSNTAPGQIAVNPRLVYHEIPASPSMSNPLQFSRLLTRRAGSLRTNGRNIAVKSYCEHLLARPNRTFISFVSNISPPL